jgi:hypothetical protein
MTDQTGAEPPAAPSSATSPASAVPPAPPAPPPPPAGASSAPPVSGLMGFLGRRLVRGAVAVLVVLAVVLGWGALRNRGATQSPPGKG